MEDAGLIKLFQAGQRDSFGQLYDRYIEKIYNFVFYRVRHRQTAEDLTSLVFTKALEKLVTFNNQSGTFQAWIYRIARNTVIDHYRTAKQTVDLDSIFEYGNVDKEIQNYDNREQLEQVKVWLGDLTDEQRELVILRVWDGLSYQEIGQILEKNPDNCKVMFSRIIRKIRDKQELAMMLLLLLRFVK